MLLNLQSTRRSTQTPTQDPRLGFQIQNKKQGHDDVGASHEMKSLVSQIRSRFCPNVAYRGFDNGWRLVSLVRVSDTGTVSKTFRAVPLSRACISAK